MDAPTCHPFYEIDKEYSKDFYKMLDSYTNECSLEYGATFFVRAFNKDFLAKFNYPITKESITAGWIEGDRCHIDYEKAEEDFGFGKECVYWIMVTCRDDIRDFIDEPKPKQSKA